jgi:glycosyltransferase involved in cell wall biosynthesis
MYRRNVTTPHLLLTGWTAEPSDLELSLRIRFDVRVRGVRRPPAPGAESFAVVSKRALIAGELWLFARLLVTPAFYRGRWRFVSGGGHYGTLLFARLLRAAGRGPRVYLMNFYLHGLANHPLVRRILRFLLTDQVRVIAQTRGDAEYFAAFLERDNIVVIPYGQGDPFAEEDYAPEAGGYVFSGGWTNRDYDALLRVAARLPDLPFEIVASTRSSIRAPCPDTVTLHYDLPQREFHRLLAASAFVVVPLLKDVGSSGQMDLLAGMAAGKAIVVPDIGAVADYVVDGVTGKLYDLGDDEALYESIRALGADRQLARRMGRAARTAYRERYTLQQSSRSILRYVSAD